LPPFKPIDKGKLVQAHLFWESQFDFKGLYAARLEEGAHLARFRATDVSGLSAETTEAFEFNLAPTIHNFKVMPDALRQMGGPSFTATIYDQGGDLDKDGIALSIDGRGIDADHFYYDPGSGYFAVEGDLTMSDGGHLAKLVATDNRGNHDEAQLRFARLLKKLTAQVVGGDAGLAIDAITLMEIENQNGDGRVNPGELVRLFIALKNDSDWQGLQCRGYLSAENDKMNVETDSILYGAIGSGATIAPMKGFDLRVDDRILDDTASDPFDTHLNLTVQCEEEGSRRLPMVLPIYRPTLAVDINTSVQVRLDRLPSSTTEDRMAVQGDVSSTGSYIAEMWVRVNGRSQGPVRYSRKGGRFESTIDLSEGDNLIEVEVLDEKGARGFDRGYVHRADPFVPPTITITSPDNGDDFQCEEVIVTGAFDTGSGVLGEILVESEGAGFTQECTITAIGGDNFSANCGDMDAGGTYDIRVTMETNEGGEAADSISILVRDCV
ncbi:MAG: hypothetical protein JJV98_11730, partial [Desulfosarcina sp.]|nr:hypothetical protein [Desulfobacterales bacterium]